MLVLRRRGPGADPGRRAGPPQAQPGPARPPRRRCSARCGAARPPPSWTWSATSSTSWSPTPPRSRCSCNAWWPRLSAPTALARLGRPRTAGPARRRRRCPAPSSELLAASYARTADLPRTAGLDRRRRRPAGRAGQPARPGARESRSARRRCSCDERRRVSPRWSPPPTGWPRRARSTRSTSRTRPTPTSWSTRRRTSPRCSGGCCGGAAPSASWTIVGDPAQSSWPDAAEADRARSARSIGTAPVRRFRMSTNYRSPAEVFDLAAQVVVAGLPRGRPAHAPSARPGSSRGCSVADRARRRGRGRGRGRRPAGRGRGHGRRHLPADPPRRRCAPPWTRPRCPAPTGWPW